MAAESAGSGARYPVKIIRYEKGGRKRKKKLERNTITGLATRAVANSPELTPAWAAMTYGPSRPAVGLECGSGISTFRRLIAWGSSSVFILHHRPQPTSPPHRLSPLRRAPR